MVSTDDRDLALLLGDQLYALGLSRLAALGDLDAVAELADVISLIAQAHADADAELAEAVWEAGAVAIGWGPRPATRTRKGWPGARTPAPRPPSGRHPRPSARCPDDARRDLVGTL